jgi:hypothetical protein
LRPSRAHVGWFGFVPGARPIDHAKDVIAPSGDRSAIRKDQRKDHGLSGENRSDDRSSNSRAHLVGCSDHAYPGDLLAFRQAKRLMLPDATS